MSKIQAKPASNPTAVAVAKILQASVKAGGNFWFQLRERMEPLSLEEAEKVAKEARELLREGGYDQKRDGSAVADVYLSDMLFCKKHGQSIPEKRGAMTAMRKQFKKPNAKKEPEGEGEQAAGEAYAKQREAFTAEAEGLAQGFDSELSDLLAFAKDGWEMRGFIPLIRAAVHRGVPDNAIRAAIVSLTAHAVTIDEGEEDAEVIDDETAEIVALLQQDREAA